MLKTIRKNAVTYGPVGVLFIGLGLGIAAAIIQLKKDLKTYPLENVVVMSIVRYSTISSEHYRVTIYGEEAVIKFPASRWNQAIGAGDTVDLIVRKGFTLGDGLEGVVVKIDN